jgi:hypothetical protein
VLFLLLLACHIIGLSCCFCYYWCVTLLVYHEGQCYGIHLYECIFMICNEFVFYF